MKEGGLSTLFEVACIVFVGSLISNLVCYALWPQSATVNLQTNMVKTLDSFSTLLKLLTNTFLLEGPLHHPSQQRIQKAVSDHQASFTSLKKNLSEARSESLCGGPSDRAGVGSVDWGTGRAYEDAVDSLNRLAQHLNGLRSGTRLQYELAKAYRDGTVAPQGGKGKDQSEHASEAGDEAAVMLTAAASMFGDFVEELGPPLSALSVSPSAASPFWSLRFLQRTCTSAIRRLRKAFAQKDRASAKELQDEDFIALAAKIERALFMFDSTSNHAVVRLYKRSDLSRIQSTTSISDEENPIIAAPDNEDIFLVYL